MSLRSVATSLRLAPNACRVAADYREEAACREGHPQIRHDYPSLCPRKALAVRGAPRAGQGAAHEATVALWAFLHGIASLQSADAFLSAPQRRAVELWTRKR
jgi:hypothetical protein